MAQTLTPYEALTEALERAGGQTAIARICGVSQPSVWKWVQSAKRVPAEYVLRVEAATGVSRHDLRPDIYPRGLVDGEPFDTEEATVPAIIPVVPSNRRSGFDGRDRHTNGSSERFYGAAAR